MKQVVGFLLSFQVAACFAQKNAALATVEDELSYAFGRIFCEHILKYGSLTNKKIRYRFNGKYFVKLNP